LIEIDEINCEAKTHVREWFNNTSLTSARLQEFGGKSWIKKDLPLLREITQRQVQVVENISPALDKAELYMRDRKFEDALDLLRKLPQNIPIVRRLLIEALHALGKWDDLIGLISQPLNPDELGIVVDALCRKADFNRANLVISECEIDTLTYDKGFIDALRKRVEAEKKVAIRRE
jgi:hypothetical protein